MGSRFRILVLVMAGLHHGLAKELVRCGKMQKTAVSEIWRCPDYVNHFGAYCHNPMSYQALFSRLPDDLQMDMWQNWQVNSYHLAQVLYGNNYEESDLILQTSAWFLKAADEGLEICWHLDFSTHLDYVSSPLGIVNGLIINVDTKDQDMPRRPYTLPLIPISTDQPLCYAATTTQYEWLRRQIKWMIMHQGGTEYWAMDKLIYDYSTWPGTIGQAMQSMMRSKYKCPSELQCESPPAKQTPFLPHSYTNFLNQLKPILERQDKICFAVNNELPDWIETSDAYWFVPGVD